MSEKELFSRVIAHAVRKLLSLSLHLVIPTIVSILMGTNCAPHVDFMTCLYEVKQAENIEAFTTSRYLDDILIIDNPYFEGMVN